MKKTKMEKGITLIALMITIVVLLILAVVAINAITKDDILGRAEDATKKYNQAVEKEQETMEKYEEYLDKITGKKVSEVQNNLISKTENTTVYDEYGNKIVVPAGFKIVVNEDTNNADIVTKGIVIEDCTEAETKGSQFVWVPVGKIYTDTARTEANAKTITLGRYENFTATDGVYTPKQIATAENCNETVVVKSLFQEEISGGRHNAKARNLEAFITSATTKCGYYIGRYEARTNNTTVRTSEADELTTVTCIKTNVVYNYVTQPQASSLSREMYSDGYKTDGTGTFSSDLINSYAWDTAIVFLQTFDNRSEEKKTTPYSTQTSLNQDFLSTGTTEDIICNIYDMASNCEEWTTEASFKWIEGGMNVNAPYVARRTSLRYWYSGEAYLEVPVQSFRTILYVGV